MKNIAEISALQLLKVIRRIEARCVDTAYRALEECEERFRSSIAIDATVNDPYITSRKALTKRSKKHFAAIIELEPNNAGSSLRAIEGFNSTFIVKCAFKAPSPILCSFR